MKFSEAFIGARGQIAWILALTLSTGAIIQLERLDIGTQAAAVQKAAEATSAKLAGEAGMALTEAEARLTASPNDPEAAASLLLALSAAVQSGAMETDEARIRADKLWDKAAAAGPQWTPAVISAAIVFAR